MSTHYITTIEDLDHTYLRVVHNGQELLIRKESVRIEINEDNTDIVNFFWHWYEYNRGVRLFFLDFNTVTDPAATSAEELYNTLECYLISQFHFPLVEKDADYTVKLEDQKRHIQNTGSSNITVTIPPISTTYDWHCGTRLKFSIKGAGNLTVSPGAGVTFLETNNYDSITSVYHCGEMEMIEDNVWHLCGDWNTGLRADTITWRDASGNDDNATLVNHVNTFIQGLEDDGVLTSFLAIYFLFCGTYAKSKWNFLDPQDTDAAFRLDENGTITWSSDGALMDDATGYLDTHIVPNTDMGVTNASHAYIGVNDLTGNEGIFGAISGGNRYLTCNPASGTYTFINGVLGTNIADTPSTSEGMWSSTRRSSTDHEGYQDGVSLGNNATAYSSLPTVNLYIGAMNNGGSTINYSPYEIKFAAFCDSDLNDTQMANTNTRVVTLMTALGIQV